MDYTEFNAIIEIYIFFFFLYGCCLLGPKKFFSIIINFIVNTVTKYFLHLVIILLLITTLGLIYTEDITKFFSLAISIFSLSLSLISFYNNSQKDLPYHYDYYIHKLEIVDKLFRENLINEDEYNKRKIALKKQFNDNKNKLLKDDKMNNP